MTHLRIWKFRPPAGGEREFAGAYGKDGDWAALFAAAEGFVGTSLLEPAEPGGWWLTIDRWASAAHFEAFRAGFSERYRALDAELGRAAGEEQFVGAFEGED